MAGPLEVYDVVYNGQETSMKLTEEQAAAMGAKKRSARNKARTADGAETKSDDGPHVCDVCGFEAKTAGGLGSHARSHEDD